MKNAFPKYIVIEGPIGVGKTSLARRLAEYCGSQLLLESPENNPFLERFYRNPKQAALATQLYFLLQRAQQLSELRQSDLFRPVYVADFLIEKDRLFAELTLDSDELQLYQQVYDHLTIEVAKPDLVIYLQAPVTTLLDRIQKRGITYEQRIEVAYLQNLIDSYTRFFYNYQNAPLLIVNSAQVNFVDNERDFLQLVQQISKTHNGRHYYNPISLDI